MFKLEKEDRRAFEFEYDGEVYSVPSVDSMPLDLVRELWQADEASDRTVLLMDWFEEQAPGIAGKLTAGEFNALVEAWGGDALGKSRASSE